MTTGGTFTSGATPILATFGGPLSIATAATSSALIAGGAIAAAHGIVLHKNYDKLNFSEKNQASKGSDISKKTIKSLKDLGIKNGISMKSNRALELAEKYLGKDYKYMGNGRYLSKDGLRQVRMGKSDILGRHGGGPHINFEKLEPNPSKPGKSMIVENYHVYLRD